MAKFVQKGFISANPRLILENGQFVIRIPANVRGDACPNTSGNPYNFQLADGRGMVQDCTFNGHPVRFNLTVSATTPEGQKWAAENRKVGGGKGL